MRKKELVAKKQLLVGQGIVIKNGLVLIGKRVSPHDPNANGLWQLPAGKVEFGESVEDCVRREVKEETGYRVKLTSSLAHVSNVLWRYPKTKAYVVLLTFTCGIISGKLGGDPKENSAWKWISRADFKKFKFTPGTKQALTWWFKIKR